MKKIIVAAAFLLASCSSSSYIKKVHVNTDPNGAFVKLGEITCQTPCALDVPEGGEYILDIKKQGFKKVKVIKKVPEWQKNPFLIGTAAVITTGALVAIPELLIPTLITFAIPPLDDQEHIILAPDTKN